MAEKANRLPNPFDICPKHKGFYKSCGCDWRKGKKDPKPKEDEHEQDD